MTDNKNTDFFTSTMAKIYASQGYLDEAVRIYTHILDKYPQREDLKKTLQDLKDSIKNLKEQSRNITEASQKNAEESRLVPLFEEWITLLMRHAHILRLKKMHKELKEKQSGRTS